MLCEMCIHTHARFTYDRNTLKHTHYTANASMECIICACTTHHKSLGCCTYLYDMVDMCSIVYSELDRSCLIFAVWLSIYACNMHCAIQRTCCEIKKERSARFANGGRLRCNGFLHTHTHTFGVFTCFIH